MLKEGKTSVTISMDSRVVKAMDEVINQINKSGKENSKVTRSIFIQQIILNFMFGADEKGENEKC